MEARAQEEDADAADRPDAAQARMAFLLSLRGRGVAGVNVLRALETAPRESFTPRRHADLAWRDVALPIACGQTMSEPFVVAKIAEALDLRPHHRVLEIGSGSGYATAILAQLAQSVVSYERYRSLAVEARVRLEALGLSNAQVFWDDGLARAAEHGSFDRVVLHGAPDGPEGSPPEALAAALAEDAIVVLARQSEDGARLRRLVRGEDGWRETDVAPCRLGRVESGRSHYL